MELSTITLINDCRYHLAYTPLYMYLVAKENYVKKTEQPTNQGPAH